MDQNQLITTYRCDLLNLLKKARDSQEVRWAGFSIGGGTRRLITAYFGIYRRLLCV